MVVAQHRFTRATSIKLKSAPRSRITSPNVNASELAPYESKTLKERSLQPYEENIVQALKEMYSCTPNSNTFAIYTPDAVFHDPIGYAEGVSSIRAQFVGLAKLFHRADIPTFRVLENPRGVPSSTILIDQDVSYFRNASASAPIKTMNSLLTLETDANHRVTRHTEEWNYNRQTTSEDGFIGMLNGQRKKGLTHWVVGKE